MRPSKAVSLFYVEKGMKGFMLGQRLKDKCGMRASPTAELVFEVRRHPHQSTHTPTAPSVARVSRHPLPLLHSLRRRNRLRPACTSTHSRRRIWSSQPTTSLVSPVAPPSA